jgi:hypothetical protein
MNRRFFAKKAAGVLAAVGTAMGLRGNADSALGSCPPKPVAGEFPDGASKLFLRYEVDRNECYPKDSDYPWIVSLHHLMRDGSRRQISFVVKKVNMADLDRKIGRYS